jgi:hypothetical protein
MCAARPGGGGRGTYRHALDSSEDGLADLADAVAEVLEVAAAARGLGVELVDFLDVGAGCEARLFSKDRGAC